MKIAFIEPGLHVCGGIRRIIETSNRLVDFGHDVYIFTPKGVPTTWLPIRSKVLKLSKIRRYKFDVALFNLAEQYTIAAEVRATRKFFWVLAPEAMYKHPEIPKQALNGPFFLIANSTFTVNYCKQFSKKIKQKTIPIVPGGINPEHFKYDKDIPKHYHIMYYGSWRPWKGKDLIEQAISPLQLKTINMEVTNPPQEQIYKLYNTATTYVSMGQIEGFNFPILEAMACGCPVVCNDDGGSRDFVVHGKNAWVVPRTVSGIRAGVNLLLNNKPLRRILTAGGLKTVNQPQYLWENAAEKLEKIFEECEIT